MTIFSWLTLAVGVSGLAPDQAVEVEQAETIRAVCLLGEKLVQETRQQNNSLEKWTSSQIILSMHLHMYLGYLDQAGSS